MQTPPRTIGDHVKVWRTRRRLSQLHCALDVRMSQRHLSFIESNRAMPSRDMVLRIAEQLDVPLRDRNTMLLAAGYAPHYHERPLGDPALKAAHDAMNLILKGHEPYPAIAVDRHWTLLSANGAVAGLLNLVSDRRLLEPPVNVLRLSLDPGGLAPHIINLGEWSHHLLARLRRQIDVSADPRLQALLAELFALPLPQAEPGLPDPGVILPLRIRTPAGQLNLFSTITVFGTPVEVTLSEIALEAFYPADAATSDALRRMAAQTP